MDLSVAMVWEVRRGKADFRTIAHVFLAALINAARFFWLSIVATR